MNKHRFRQAILLISAVVVLVTVILLIAVTGAEKNTSQKIGLIITGEINDSGWNGVHYNGVVSACEKLGTELIVKENVNEGSGMCAEAIHELVDEGAEMIILSSYSYPVEAKSVIESYPDIAFYAISSEYVAENLTSYFGRMYQARYLSGIVAGMQTENGAIGYVAAMPNNEVNRGINAFTLGVKSVNPEATVYVSWTNSWDDEEKETVLTENLIKNKSVDVITYHQNQHYTAQAADKAGVYSIGYNEPAEGLSDKYLTAAVWNWDTLYFQIIREFIQGQPNEMERRWFSIESGVVALSELSAQVGDESRQAVEAAQNRLLMGNDVFSGLIYDNNNVLKCSEGEILSDETLLKNMDWFVEGVEIYNEES
ncbi:MAG: BMP family ABC transporter substrate-binding protein [Oscillospiraceae bacterium]|nr:BMP family ABC transporter substrate-binding protein [Oscillospiraceae bacterium]